MFARTLLGFALAGLLAASPVLAVEEYEPTLLTEVEQPAPEAMPVPDKRLPEETVATTDGEVPVDAEG